MSSGSSHPAEQATTAEIVAATEKRIAEHLQGKVEVHGSVGPYGEWIKVVVFYRGPPKERIADTCKLDPDLATENVDLYADLLAEEVKKWDRGQSVDAS